MKDFDRNKQSEGLGDFIAKLTYDLGIMKVADKVAESLEIEDCGCERRREALNKLIPFNKNKEENAERKTDSGEGTSQIGTHEG